MYMYRCVSVSVYKFVCNTNTLGYVYLCVHKCIMYMSACMCTHIYCIAQVYSVVNLITID